MKKILLGDEAYAQGVLDAGLSGCYAYPGTPSTEIMEYVQNSKLAAERGIHREWSSNEKTAMEEALGVSYAGKRAIVCMKHVGLNVAGDGFVNSAVTGTNGGLLVTVADDPSMHSSQNEQDSRFYAQFAMIPCIEPSSQQECYDLAKYAFELSEKNEIPVLIRLTTRLSHSRSNIETADAPSAMNDLHAPNNPRRFVLLPAIAKGNVKKLCEKQADFAKLSEESPFNKLIDGKDTSLGIVATGIAYNYVMEAFGGNCPYPILKISQYPLPKKMLSTLLNKCDKIMVVEEGAPYLVAKAFDLKVAEPPAIPDLVKMRPPRLCDGCPHVSTYNALKEAIAKFEDPRVFGDIGCYTLGALPPFQAISSCVDMGASVTMAKGAADAGIHPSVAVIGDSTFTHSGMTGILDAVWENANITVMILDNGTTGMTGGQTSIGAGRLETICIGLGVNPDHVKVITPLPQKHAENVETIAAELKYEGLSVIVSRRECIQTLRRKK